MVARRFAFVSYLLGSTYEYDCSLIQILCNIIRTINWTVSRFCAGLRDFAIGERALSLAESHACMEIATRVHQFR